MQNNMLTLHQVGIWKLCFIFYVFMWEMLRPISLKSSIVLCYNVMKLTYWLTYLFFLLASVYYELAFSPSVLTETCIGPNTRDRRIVAKKSQMKKIALRESRTANALPLCIADSVDVVRRRPWVYGAVGQQFTARRRRRRSAVCRAAGSDTLDWFHFGDESVRTADGRTRQAISPNRPRQFGLKMKHYIPSIFSGL